MTERTGWRARFLPAALAAAIGSVPAIARAEDNGAALRPESVQDGASRTADRMSALRPESVQDGASRTADRMSALRPDTTGFYPLWEGTAHVERNGDVHLGTTGAQVGIGDLAHVGVQPINYLFRTPNAYLKVPLLGGDGWAVAGQIGAYHLLEGASRAFYSPMFASRLDNPDFAVNLIPASLSASIEVASWLEIHQTLTGLGVVSSGPLKNAIEPGYSVIAELNPHERHAITLHAGEVGLWSYELAYAGAAYRYRSGWLEIRLGYFYRFTPQGAQGAPLVGIGVLL